MTLLFALASIGFTNIMVDSRIMQPLRTWLQGKLQPGVYELFECHQCMGFWAGLLCSFGFITWNPLVAVLYGCAGSFLATVAHLLLEFIISKTQFVLEPPHEAAK